MHIQPHMRTVASTISSLTDQQWAAKYREAALPDLIKVLNSLLSPKRNVRLGGFILTENVRQAGILLALRPLVADDTIRARLETILQVTLDPLLRRQATKTTRILAASEACFIRQLHPDWKQRIARRRAQTIKAEATNG